jgi:hypothetical protein
MMKSTSEESSSLPKATGIGILQAYEGGRSMVKDLVREFLPINDAYDT